MTLYFPRAFADDDSGANRDGRLADLPSADGETVLVVDDEPAVRALITEVLGEQGYRTIEAADGAEGLALLQSRSCIELLATDVGLPKRHERKAAR